MSYTDNEIIKEANRIKYKFLNTEKLAKSSLRIPVKMGKNHHYLVEYDIVDHNGLSPMLVNPRVLASK